MNEQEQRIRAFAYEIWQTEGQPEGQGERHWEMARKLVEAQDSGIPASASASKPRKSTTKPTDVTAALSSAAEQPGSEQLSAEVAQQAKAPKATKPAKAAAAAKGNAKPKPAAGTEAAEGTPAGVKKTRTPRAKKGG